MATVVEKINLVKSDPVNNNNKFWRGTLFDNGDVLCEWGRVGDSGQSKMFSGAGKSFLDKKVREKKTHGRNDEIAYREVDIVSDVVPVKSGSRTAVVTDTKLAQIAKTQIQTGGNPTTLKLIEHFTKVNAHQICSATGGQITYNFDKGAFQTPLGLVGQSSIDQARDKLVKIGDLVADQKYTNDLMEFTRDYLMLVPQDIGRRQLDLHEFWADLQKVQNQNAILDGLQASLTQAVTPKDKDAPKVDKPVEQVFNCKVELCEDGGTIDKIRKLYEKTRQSVHQCYHLGVRKVYTIDINTVRTAFQRDGAKLQNVWDLWHGTKASNILSILKGGLIIPPSTSAHVCGRMFGDGLYFSDQSTKSLNYAYGYWGGGSNRDDNCFMFLCRVGMGNYYVPKSSFSAKRAPAGFDSTFAQAHKSSVMNNEMIVYRVSQADLQYLIEFSPHGK